MKNLYQSATEIVQNSPESAVPLYDILIHMRSPNATLGPDYDQTLEMLYALTPDSRSHRESYEESRAAAA